MVAVGGTVVPRTSLDAGGRGDVLRMKYICHRLVGEDGHMVAAG
jgi:hypothetical protein